MKQLKISALMLAAALSIASCTSSPKSDEAQLSQAKTVSQAKATDQLNINTAESQMTWVGTKPSGRHNGTIAIEQGTLKLNNDQLIGGDIIIDLNQIDVLDLEGEYETKLAGHLKSADFFDVANHPKATFEITNVEPLKAQANASAEKSEFKIENPTHTVSGNLTLRGKTLGISFPAKIEQANGTLKAQAKFNIDRTKWGVSYNEESSAVEIGKDKIIHNTVNVGFDIVANK